MPDRVWKGEGKGEGGMKKKPVIHESAGVLSSPPPPVKSRGINWLFFSPNGGGGGEEEKQKANPCVPRIMTLHGVISRSRNLKWCHYGSSSLSLLLLQVMETKNMLYLVCEYASNGEMFGEYRAVAFFRFSTTICSDLRSKNNISPLFSEPRSKPRSEPRSEPHSEPRSEPHSEPRSEPRFGRILELSKKET